MKHQSACKFCHEIFEETDDYDKHFADCSPESAAEDKKHNPDQWDRYLRLPEPAMCGPEGEAA